MPLQVVGRFVLVLLTVAAAADSAAAAATKTAAAPAAVAAAAAPPAAAQNGGRLRARGLGVPFDGTPGPLNAITDIPGVLVGHTTLIEGSGKLTVGKGPIRTGVTAVLPRGLDSMRQFSFAGGSHRTATAR